MGTCKPERVRVQARIAPRDGFAKAQHLAGRVAGEAIVPLRRPRVGGHSAARGCRSEPPY